jgi:phosphoribosylaminoimidazole-succinocarboxamide synthase
VASPSSKLPPEPLLFDAPITSLPRVHRGKVRDIFAVGDAHLLIVTTDRLSAFDVVLPQPIPGKGGVLTRLTQFWMDRFAAVIPHQLAPEMRLADWLTPDEIAAVQGRAVIVRKLRALPVECVARGYLIGSGWKDYRASGQVCGITLPAGLQLAERLPQPIFTPANKADVGEHDENIGFDDVVQRLGANRAAELRDITLRLYHEAAEYALPRGLIIADTKFEFGVDANDRLHLIDEALTPDSSRFWDAAAYVPGNSPPSFDKQIVRDHLETLDWNKAPPGPDLPADVIARTAARYREAEQRLVRMI